MTNIPFVDVETTGLDAGRDHLLEIAVVVMNADLSEELGSYHAVVAYDKKVAGRFRGRATPYVQEMHDKTGLWKKLSEPGAKDLTTIDVELARFLAEFGAPRTMPVAGNSVRLDLNFIDANLPWVAEHLDYHMRDVSTVAGFASDWFDLPWFEKTSDHTAMTDIRESIREIKHYRETVFKRRVSETERTPDDSFEEWLAKGIANGWAGPDICIPHDSYPTTELEDEDPDECWHVVRLYPDAETKAAVEENHSPSNWRKPR